MFNLLISNGVESWRTGSYEIDKSRVAIEYTADEISERYRDFTLDSIEEMKGFPCLFVTENEETPSRIGYITNVRIRTSTIVIQFEFDAIFQELPIGAIRTLKTEIDLGRWELSRTHWALKDEPLFDILLRQGFINQEQLAASQAIRQELYPDPAPAPLQPGDVNTNQVFIVHGHDETAKLEAAQFVSELGLEPIILHLQPSSGMTIIEKIAHYSDVGFAIVLYTPCDIGYKVGAMTSFFRARQNVVFEHGYLIGKLGRQRVTAIVKGQIETPNDISGVVYVTMNDTESWKEETRREMRALGYQV